MEIHRYPPGLKIQEKIIIQYNSKPLIQAIPILSLILLYLRSLIKSLKLHSGILKIQKINVHNEQS